MEISEELIARAAELGIDYLAPQGISPEVRALMEAEGIEVPPDPTSAGIFIVPEEMEFAPGGDKYDEDEDDEFTQMLMEHLGKPIEPKCPECEEFLGRALWFFLEPFRCTHLDDGAPSD